MVHAQARPQGIGATFGLNLGGVVSESRQPALERGLELGLEGTLWMMPAPDGLVLARGLGLGFAYQDETSRGKTLRLYPQLELALTYLNADSPVAVLPTVGVSLAPMAALTFGDSGGKAFGLQAATWLGAGPLGVQFALRTMNDEAWSLWLSCFFRVGFLAAH